MLDSEKIEFNMTVDEIKLASEYDDMTNQIKDLTKKLKKQRMSLKSTRVNASEELKIKESILDTENHIKHRIFARNKVNDKLYGSEVEVNDTR